MATSRPCGLRRRDLHLVLIVSAVVVANVATTALYWVVVRRDRDRLTESMNSTFATLGAVASNALTRADIAAAHSAALALRADVDEDGQLVYVEPDRILGAGRTKTVSGRPVGYYDVRLGRTGEVERRYFTARNLPSKQDRSADAEGLPDASERSEAEEDVAD